MCLGKIYCRISLNFILFSLVYSEVLNGLWWYFYCFFVFCLFFYFFLSSRCNHSTCVSQVIFLIYLCKNIVYTSENQDRSYFPLESYQYPFVFLLTIPFLFFANLGLFMGVLILTYHSYWHQPCSCCICLRLSQGLTQLSE